MISCGFSMATIILAARRSFSHVLPRLIMYIPEQRQPQKSTKTPKLFILVARARLYNSARKRKHQKDHFYKIQISKSPTKTWLDKPVCKHIMEKKTTKSKWIKYLHNIKSNYARQSLEKLTLVDFNIWRNSILTFLISSSVHIYGQIYPMT